MSTLYKPKVCLPTSGQRTTGKRQPQARAAATPSSFHPDASNGRGKNDGQREPTDSKPIPQRQRLAGVG